MTNTAQKFNVSQLPKGIELSGFNELYDKPYGKWDLHLFMKNTSPKTIEYPQIDADLYIDGKVVGTVTGGPNKHLLSGDSAVVSLAWILPNQVPDEIIFKSNLK